MDEDEMKNEIKDFIRSKNRIAGTNGAVIGLSGGIDSTLVAYLTVDTLGFNNVFGLLMPDKVTPKQDIEDAINIAKILKMDFEIVDISDILQSFLSTIPLIGNDMISVNGNLKARIRMCILYYYANSLNRLVVGTGNKTELLLGYFTKYGDGGVDIEPIGGLYKTQVRALAKYVGVPQNIIDKVPTAGLWEGQTDEGELGITYETIDRILGMIDNNKHKREGIESCDI